ncbi:MAG: hypothetical protein FWG83_08200 [Oscillospiraceae bacterium]|nr:hypothetical protein [Oscillospiraceae bacterium]
MKKATSSCSKLKQDSRIRDVQILCKITNRTNSSALDNPEKRVIIRLETYGR